MNYNEFELIEARVNRTIYDNDTMRPRNGDIERYLEFGRCSVRAIRSAHVLADREAPSSILDYGSGSGRILRWLRAWQPDADIYAADIKKDAITFCQEQFSAIPFLVEKPFREMNFPQKFDCIWLGSVYTHINEKGWNDLTEILSSYLSEDGLLCFSVGGITIYRSHKAGLDSISNPIEAQAMTAMVQGYERDGFGFLPRDIESHDIWGRAIVRLDYLGDFLDRKGLEIVLYTERAYGGRQDIVCARKRAVPIRRPERL